MHQSCGYGVAEIYRLMRWRNNIRVVFSIDFMSTFVFGVMGEFASLRGLKLRTALTILLDVPGLVRIRIERVLSVPSTSRASLRTKLRLGLMHIGLYHRTPYLLLSCSVTSMRSKRPMPSASKWRGSKKGWFGGIMTSDTSRPRYLFSCS